jgi:hypothetical protein
MKLTDEDLLLLQQELLLNPEKGAIIQRTGGARKIRVALNKGKSGGARVIYVDVPRSRQIILLLCYQKGKQDNLTVEQKAELKILVKKLKGENRDG